MLTDFLRVLTTMMREIKFLKGCHSSFLSGGCRYSSSYHSHPFLRAEWGAAAAARRLRWAAERSAVLPSATLAAAVWATTN